jgi:hypothetical protein
MAGLFALTIFHDQSHDSYMNHVPTHHVVPLEGFEPPT